MANGRSSSVGSELEAFQTSVWQTKTAARRLYATPGSLNCSPIAGHFILSSQSLILLKVTMLSRSSFGRTAQRALRTHTASSRRAFASAASPALQYETSEASGIKVANRELEGPTSTLALVAKAGSRYQPFPGYADVLERFAFQVCSQPLTSKSHCSPQLVAQGYVNALRLSFSAQWLMCRAIASLPSNEPVCVSLVRQSFWVATSQPSTVAKALSSRLSSCLETFPTSPSSLRRLAPRQSTVVSGLMS